MRSQDSNTSNEALHEQVKRIRREKKVILERLVKEIKRFNSVYAGEIEYKGIPENV